ncbi:amidohydrolase family-domain-containing protein [Rhodofomes roseus]|uniref:Amidohydrolase family-domain-containing protein n=1 Tax=Rhodofomes roseus TaxID=34475 RepID=A0ABQ8KJB2_9APHY|nr:amidohydrolase family-domain-containing protein [Rhodofomes roseus]KAH9837926.1 amidohydrolase family-domain-containing protein [Rhodofomes roseus]
MPAHDKKPPPAPAKLRQAAAEPKKAENIARRLAFVFLAAALAGIATYVSRVGHGGATRRVQAVTSVPESYAVCTDPGLVYTVDERRPNADCLLVKKDRIAATGTLEEIQAEWDVYQIDLVNKFYGGESKAKKPLKVIRPPSGSIIIPGLADAHAHLMMYGAKMQLNLEGAETIDEVLDRIEHYVASHPAPHDDGVRWVEGFGWDQTRWKDWRGGFPSKTDLASRPSLAGIPMALSRVDGHALWVSDRALELAEAKLPGGRWPGHGEVEGGEVMKDKNGKPTGVLVDSAMALIPVPPPSEAQMTEQLERAVKDALAVGLTSVHDAAVNGRMLNVFKKMADDGRLPIRVYAMANEESSEYWGGRFERLEDYGKDGRLNLRSVKLFTDGALGSWGAALLEPYSDNPSTSGLMRSSEEALKQTVTKFWNDGWGVNIHCIGDRANKAVLDIFEGLLQGNESAAQRRPRIEHAQIMRREDLTRAGQLGVITSVQPTHATSDMWYAESRLGPDRILGAYAYQSLLQLSSNKVLPLGSDFPVEGIKPLLGFYAAVSRLDGRGESPHGPGGWFPSERLTRAQALKGMTFDAAYASFAEGDLGSLSVGKKADYVVLDRDIMNEGAAFTDILATQVRATVIDGRVLHGGI